MKREPADGLADSSSDLSTLQTGYIASLTSGLERLRLWHVILFVIAIKLVFLSVDNAPRVFLGDSRSYIFTALTDWVPDDRSYTYGVLIRLVTSTTHNLLNLVRLQTLFMTAASICVVIILRRYLSAPVWLAGLAGVVCAVEPLQLLSERFVMTEASSLFFFALYATLAFRYLKYGDFLSLLVMPVFGVASISFRVSFLPAVIFSAFALPLMAPPALQLYRELLKRGTTLVSHFPAKSASFVALQLLLSIRVTTAELHIYKVWYGEKSSGPPAYIQSDGLFLLSFAAPILSADDFRDKELGKRVLSKVILPLEATSARTGHLLHSGGLIEALLREMDPHHVREDWLNANKVARKTAVRAITNHPLGLAKLVWATLLSYWDRDIMRSELVVDEFQDTPFDKDSQEILRQVGLVSTRQAPAGPVVRWHSAAWCWYAFLVSFAPLYTFAVLITGAWRQPPYILLVAYGWAFFVLAMLTTEPAMPRYETPQAWLAPLATAALLSRQLRMR